MAYYFVMLWSAQAIKNLHTILEEEDIQTPIKMSPNSYMEGASAILLVNSFIKFALLEIVPLHVGSALYWAALKQIL